MIQERVQGMALAALIMVIAVAGCGGQSEQASQTATDSLLAASPIEDPEGDITPQSEFEGDAPKPEPPAKPAPTKPAAKPKPKPTPPPPAPVDPGVKVPVGTEITLTTNFEVNSEFAKTGDTWSGVVTEPVVLGSRAPIPAGSTVRGVVTGAEPAERGNRAFLVLAVTAVEINGKTHALSADTDSIIAGSPRARNLGAVAGGAAAGALIGKAVGGGKGALIGGLIGGAAATAGVAKSKGYQVVLKEGTELTFEVSKEAVIKD